MLRTRLLLLVAGVVAFFLAVRLQNDPLRWLSIVLVAAALLLRFVRPSHKP